MPVLRLVLLWVLLCNLMTPTQQQGDPSEQVAWVRGKESAAVKCGGGSPCVWVNRDAGWVEYIPTTDPRNAGKPQPVPPVAGSWEGDSVNLVISISSFRDKLCPVTLVNMFTKAKYPERLLVQVVQQNVHSADLDCFEHYCALMEKRWKQRANPVDAEIFECPYKDNIHIMRINADEAKGPQWARAIGSVMLQDAFATVNEIKSGSLPVPPTESKWSKWTNISPGGSFCMQMDAHMDVVRDFDRLMINMWVSAKNEMAVLSTYVASTSEMGVSSEHDKGQNGLHEVPHLCMVTLHGANDLPRNWGTKCARMLPEPKLTNAVWGAGLSFSRCHAELKVPYDPHLPFIFDGEEFTRAVRFFTWGYDVYSPNRVWILHNYKDSQSDSKHNSWGSRQADSKIVKPKDKGSILPYDAVPTILVSDHIQRWSTERIKRLLEMGDRLNKDRKASLAIQLSKYGLGDRRTLDQACAFSGVNLKERRMTANRCGNIDYVPYVPHPSGAAYIPLYDEKTEAFIDERDRGSIYYGVELPAELTAMTGTGVELVAELTPMTSTKVALGETQPHSRSKPQIATELKPSNPHSGTKHQHQLSLHGLEPLLALVLGRERLRGLENIQDDFHLDGRRTNLTIQQEIDAIFLLLAALCLATVWIRYRRRLHHGKAFGGDTRLPLGLKTV